MRPVRFKVSLLLLLLLYDFQNKPQYLQVSILSSLSVSADSVDEDEPSVGAFQNHNGPVTGLQIYEGLLFTCSGDNTARAYDLQVCR